MSRSSRAPFPAILAAGVIALLSACAATPERAGGVPDEIAAPVRSAADPAGRITGYQFARRYEDVVRIDGNNVHQVVEYGFDYDLARTVRRIYTPQGELVDEQPIGPESLRANPAEEARLVELVSTHPQLGPLMREPGLLVHSGGFVFREPDDPYCSRGSRCLRFIVSKGDGSIPHIHAVVDLVSDLVVYPFYETHVANLAARKEQHQ